MVLRSLSKNVGSNVGKPKRFKFGMMNIRIRIMLVVRVMKTERRSPRLINVL